MKVTAKQDHELRIETGSENEKIFVDTLIGKYERVIIIDLNHYWEIRQKEGITKLFIFKDSDMVDDCDLLWWEDAKIISQRKRSLCG